jgi:nitrogen fixation/metabolism regulation signal transduction histidine kinase
MEGDNGNNAINAPALSRLKHDIKNQLSNIQLALEGLKYETADRKEELSLYVDSISRSAIKIDKLLNDIKY